MHPSSIHPSICPFTIHSFIYWVCTNIRHHEKCCGYKIKPRTPHFTKLSAQWVREARKPRSGCHLLSYAELWWESRGQDSWYIEGGQLLFTKKPSEISDFQVRMWLLSVRIKLHESWISYFISSCIAHNLDNPFYMFQRHFSCKYSVSPRIKNWHKQLPFKLMPGYM